LLAFSNGQDFNFLLEIKKSLNHF